MAKKSPFPGMDPYLEESWGDVHHGIISELRKQIADKLPPDLYSVIDETPYFIDSEEELHHVRPDVAVIEHRNSASAFDMPPDHAVAVAEPFRITISHDPMTLGTIEIRDVKRGNPIVTVIEVLSPANKSHTAGRAQYLAKRETYYSGALNLMELDLLRAGPHTVAIPEGLLSGNLMAPYKACVCLNAPEAESDFEYYPMALRSRLPRIAVPLRQTDSRVVVDLQMAVDQAYRLGGYWMHLDYGKAPKPPLSKDDAAWATELIAAARQ